MSPDSLPDYTSALRSLMQQAGIASFRELWQAAEVSEWQVRQLRQGKAAEMRVEALHRLSQALGVSLMELLAQFTELPGLEQPAKVPEAPAETEQHSDVVALRQEYQRLQEQLQAQQESLKQDFQQASLQVLESWLLQFPTAAYAAQQNPQVPAVRLIPLMRPVEQLVQSWGVEPIAAVGAEIPYDPQQQQLMDGVAQAGDRVRVRYTGYRQGDRLLYRAKVSPV